MSSPGGDRDRWWTSIGSTLVAAATLLTAGFAFAAANQLPQQKALSVQDVDLIVRQVVAEARARNTPAVVAVTDRVGNTLAVYTMAGARQRVIVAPGRPTAEPNGLAGQLLPAPAAAIAKAITGAYLSSGGNAFSTRTAGSIIQENFNPGTPGLEGGPLFGVQFSQLPCSDLSVRFESNNGGTIDPTIGPKRSPLGFSADPGGLPLYKGSTQVGGIGVVADGSYGIDLSVRDQDKPIDEILAVAGTRNYEPPSDLRAERIAVDGRSLRYSNVQLDDLATGPNIAAQINLSALGAFTPVRGYYLGGGPLRGQAFGFGASGIRPAPPGLFLTPRAYLLTTADGVNRFPPRSGAAAGGASLTQREVRRIMIEALGVALAARGQIRRPLGSHAEVTISVSDLDGTILGVVRTPDAPVFGTDVSLQKGRTAAFFSSEMAPAALRAIPGNPLGRRPGSYVQPTFRFLGPDALGGTFAHSTRTIGNISRPFYPDGTNGASNGPLSVPFRNWSPFYTGLQLDAGTNALLAHLGFVLNDTLDTEAPCLGSLFGATVGNGLQIFSGGMPIYRGRTLIGGIGISGDGIDQDGMIAFLGLDRAGKFLETGVGNAPPAIRADQLFARNVNLRYVSCPFTPFLGSDAQNVCQGL